MPIFKELANLNQFSFWKSLQQVFKPSPQEYIRKIGEHFIAFIHKLDSSECGAECSEALYPSGMSCGEYWVQAVGVYLLDSVG